MFGFDVVAELGLALHSGKGAGLIQGDGMCPVQDRVAGLDEEQVELDRIARVDVAVREEVLAPQQDRFALVDPLLPQRLRVIHPIHCSFNNKKWIDSLAILN